MKINIYKMLLLFGLLISRPSVMLATHVIGGEITYKYIGNDSFFVSSVFYRDCNGIPISGGDITITPSGSTSFDVTTTKLLSRDITPVTASTHTRCSNSSSTFPYGITMYTFTGKFKTDGTTCNYTISENECCLTGAITTGAASTNFYLESQVNVCDAGYHNSPSFEFDPLVINCINTCINLYQNATSDDGDSLVYSLTLPLNATGQSTPYSSPYSVTAPLDYSGSDPSAAWTVPQCLGFHFDPLTGLLNFKATKVDETVLCVKVDQWHKNSSGVYKDIGAVVRQTSLALIDCAPNHQPNLTGINGSSSNKITACIGSPVSFNISGFDLDSKDSVKMVWDNSIPGASFNVTTNPQKPVGTFYWSPKAADIRTAPYNFIVTITDNFSPVPGKYQQMFSINLVNDSFPKVSYSKKYDGCGMYTFLAKTDSTLKTKFNWTVDAANISTNKQFNYKFSNASEHHIDLQLTSALGCMTQIQDSFKSDTIYKAKTSFSVSGNICGGLPITITNNSKPPIGTGQGLKYLWKFGDTTTSTSAQPVKSYSKSGTYTIWLITKTDSGCLDSISQPITINATANESFSASETCFGGVTTFTNTSSIPSGSGGSITSSLWRFGDGSTSLLKSPSKKYAVSGIYAVKLIETTSAGCIDSMTQNITVYPLPASSFAISGGCSNDSTHFINTTTIGGGFTVASTNWNFGDAGTSIKTNPVHKYAKPGNYTVSLISKSDKGCIDTSKQTITIISGPKAAMNPLSNNCPGVRIQFTDNSVINSFDSIKSWQWNFGDNVKSVLQNPSHVYIAGAFDVTLKIVTKGGCDDSITKGITIFPAPNANFTSTVVGHRAYNFVASDQTLSKYQWDFGDKTTGTGPNISHTYYKDSTYKVILTTTNTNSCVNSNDEPLVINTTGISSMVDEKELNLKLSPNPCNDIFNFSYTLKNQSNVRVAIVDITGKTITIISQGIQAQGIQNYSVNTVDYQMKPGVYTLIIAVNGQTVTKEIVKQH